MATKYARNTDAELRAMLTLELPAWKVAEIQRELAEREGLDPGGEIGQPPAQLPIRLVVPWSALASDNLRDVPFGKTAAGKRARYDAALEKFRGEVGKQYRGAPHQGPGIVIIAEIYVPDRDARDAPNFAKIIPDGLKKLVIEDDRWAIAPRWTFDVVDVDRDRPRCEITITRRAG